MSRSLEDPAGPDRLGDQDAPLSGDDPVVSVATIGGPEVPAAGQSDADRLTTGIGAEVRVDPGIHAGAAGQLVAAMDPHPAATEHLAVGRRPISAHLPGQGSDGAAG